MCRTCGGPQERVLGQGFAAWVCPRCGRASVHMWDVRVWRRFRLVFEHGVLDGLPSRHKPQKTYVLKKHRPCPT